MKRTILLLITMVLVVAGSAAAVAAADDDEKENKATAESCKKEGWKTLTGTNGELFKNQGQCMKYVKDGGDLLRTDNDEGDIDVGTTARGADQDDELSLKIIDGTKPWDGYLEGSGFTPGEKLTKVTFESDRETLNLASPVGTTINDDGTFRTERIIYWCSEFHGYGEPEGIVTVENSGGETYSQTFEMAEFCGPRE